MKYFPLFLCLVLLVSCKNDKKENMPEVKTVDMEKQIHQPAELEARFKDKKIAEAYRGYNAVKSALVNSDAKKTHDAANKLSDMLSKTGFSNNITDVARTLAQQDGLEQQRMVFQKLTDEMLKLVEANVDSGQLYYQYCPMAFEGKGGYWLSNGKEIRNPYYGDMMLKCGKVERVIN